MAGSFMTGSPLVGIPLVVFFLFAISPLLAEAGSEAASFPLPKRIVPLSASVTPHEYAEIEAAIKKEMSKPQVTKELQRGAGLGPLNQIIVARVPLGTLGDGMMVNFRHSPSCGTGGCPMWLFLRGPQGYRNVIKEGGWGFSLAPSGQSSSVPDIAFYWQMGAGETDVAQYHFAQGEFVSVVASPAKCGDEDDTRGVCAGRSSQRWVWSITSAEYDSLAREVQDDPKSPAVVQQPFSDEAHAIDFPLVNDKIARVVGLGRCTAESNCTISIYGCEQTYPHATYQDRASVMANLSQCEYWPMLRGVSGWGVTDVSDFTTDPFSPRVAFVIARRLSATTVELTRYSIVTQPAGPNLGSTLLPDSCQVASLETAKSPDGYSPHLLTPPQPCSDHAAYRRSGR
jgi:hypothetical protein